MNSELPKNKDEEVYPYEKQVGTRLKVLFAEHGGPNFIASDVLKMSYGQVNRYQSGEAMMRMGEIKKLCEYTGVRADWLIWGTLPVYQKDVAGEADMVREPQTEYEDTAPRPGNYGDEYAFIPGYNVTAAAGSGSVVEGEQVTRRLAFQRKWLKKEGLSEKDLVAIYADGDSMEPTISNNNTLLVDTSKTEPQDGRIYVIKDGDMLLVKRIQRVFGQGLLLISDNKQYKEQMIAFDQATSLEIVGRVAWVGKNV